MFNTTTSSGVRVVDDNDFWLTANIKPDLTYQMQEIINLLKRIDQRLIGDEIQCKCPNIKTACNSPHCRTMKALGLNEGENV